MKKLSGILWGIVLVAIGVILALNAFGLIGIDIFFDGWWTLFIIVPCAVGLITDSDKWGSLIGVCIGVFLLLCCQDILEFSMIWKLLIPVIVIVIGLRLIFGNLFFRRSSRIAFELKQNGADVKNGTATFSSAELNFNGEVFEGAELNAVFGGVKCNLNGAIVNRDCAINATAIFGGITIYVPEGLNVKVHSTSVFGGVSDKTKRQHNPDAPTLYINASGVFGGVDIQ